MADTPTDSGQPWIKFVVQVRPERPMRRGVRVRLWHWSVFLPTKRKV